MNANERRAFDLYYQHRRKEEKANLRYFIVQKFCGLIMIAVAVTCWTLIGEYTASTIFCLPLGVYLLFTKQKVMDF